MSDAPRTYTPIAIALHWVMAALILLNLIVGFFMETYANPSPQRNNVLFYHASIGILILALLVIRLGWRLTHPVGAANFPNLRREALIQFIDWNAENIVPLAAVARGAAGLGSSGFIAG